MDQNHQYSSLPTEATGNNTSNFENEQAMKELLRDQMQLQLFGAGFGSGAVDNENKNIFVNPAFKDAFQKGFGQNQSKAFPFVDNGFGSFMKSKKVFMQEAEQNEETDRLMGKDSSDVIVIKAKKKKSDVLMQNE